jgi:solute carrier family 8 (sodium/calcium exchanger)
MRPHQTIQIVDVIIIDDNQWEPDETFFVKISAYGEQPSLKIGHKSICTVTIIDDDEPGEIEFAEPVLVVKESVGTYEIQLRRVNGADGQVSIDYQTSDINAIENKDYEPQADTLTFEHGETTKTIEVKIIDDKSAEKDESFAIELLNPKGGARIGRNHKTVVTIINDDDLTNITHRLANMVNADLDKISVYNKTWIEQINAAMNVNGGDEDMKPGFKDYLMHVLCFPWKVSFSLLPPARIAGGWLLFFTSLTVIGVITAIVGDAAAIFGCLVGLKDSVTAITFVALGTSLPDTFASQIAAKEEKTADNAIGNITGSNSVNVFLGLGLPWCIASIYWAIKVKF